MQIWLSIFVPIAMVVLMVAGYARASKQRTARRSTGLTIAFRLRQLLALLQDHRGITYRAGKGEQGLSDLLHRIESQIEEHERALSGVIIWPREQHYWRELMEHWHRLQEHNLVLELRNNFDQHSRLIAAVLTLTEDIFHCCGLESQTQATRERSWYRVMRVAEWVGQVRAMGAGAIVCGTLWGSDKGRLLTLHKQLTKSLPEMEYLGVDTDNLKKLLQVLDKNVIPERFESQTGEAFFLLATQAMEPLRGLYDSYMEELAVSLGKIDFDHAGPRAKNDNA